MWQQGAWTHPWHPMYWGNKEAHASWEAIERWWGTALILCLILNPGYNYTHSQDHCPVRKAPTHKTCESSSSKSLAGNTFGSHSCCLNKRKKKITAPFKPPWPCNVIHQIISNCLLFITLGPKIRAASKLALVPKCILLLVKPWPRANLALTVPHNLCQLEVKRWLYSVSIANASFLPC